MNGFLLDTNVVSELMRPLPDTAVIGFLGEHDNLWLPSIVLHELQYGLQRLPQGRRRFALHDALHRVTAEYRDRILPVDEVVAVQAAGLRAQAERDGRSLDLGDALIAGTAKANDLAVATRNVRDFDGLGLVVMDPWRAA